MYIAHILSYMNKTRTMIFFFAFVKFTGIDTVDADFIFFLVYYEHK